MKDIELLRPRSLDEALAGLNAGARLLAGGTDLLVRLKEGQVAEDTIVDLSPLDELREISVNGSYVRIGSLTSHEDIAGSEIVREHIPLLARGCGSVGSVQIRNQGTIGGNLGTASPAGDSLPALVALGAKVVLASARGERTLLVEDFLLGPGKTDRRPDELIRAVLVPRMEPQEKGEYTKLGQRNAQAISIVSVAVWARFNGPRQIEAARVAFGAVAPTVVRARKVEGALVGRELNDRLLKDIAQLAWTEVAPISDIRASEGYRRDMAVATLYQTLYKLFI